LRDDFLRQAREIEEKYEKKLNDLRVEMELRSKTEIHEIEERKNQQINHLLRNHEKAFSDIKNYYNDITLNNLNLINTLKVSGEAGARQRAARVSSCLERNREEETRRRTTGEAHGRARERKPTHARAVGGGQERNGRTATTRRELREGQGAARRESMWRAASRRRRVAIVVLQSTKHRLKVCEADLKTAKWEYEVLLQRFESVGDETRRGRAPNVSSVRPFRFSRNATISTTSSSRRSTKFNRRAA
jgi:hypothetical protein